MHLNSPRRSLATLFLLPILGLVSPAAPAQATGCGPGGGNCLQAHPTPGCDSSGCCLVVCPILPSCCNTAWDAFCGDLADSLCVGYCGAAASGSCFGVHDNPACDDADCCALICGLDPFCCEESWDTACASTATFLCEARPGECGSPTAGGCFEPHAGSACSDLVCCNAVCTIDPTCCSQAWDFLCVQVALLICTPTCQVECPPGGLVEEEACGVFTNDPCLFPTPGALAMPLACGQTACGQIFDDGPGGQPIDVDVYAVTAPDPDGDGFSELKIEFRSEFVGFVAVLPPTSCGDLSSAVAVVPSQLCLSGFLNVCLPPGQWRLAVVPGTYPVPGGAPTNCGFSGSYFLRVVCAQDCGSPCSPTSGDCFVPHPGRGCNQQACCESVCESLPLCCSAGWDLACAQAAVGLCGGSPPANDSCQNCLTVSEGSFAFTTIGATSDGPQLPPTCDEGFGVAMGNDIWYCYTPSCNALITVETCDAAQFDTRLAVYTGACGNLSLVACNDDALCFFATTSRLTFQAQCRVQYRIRLGGFEQAAGVGTLTIHCGFGPPCPPSCPADLTGDGEVGGADLGILLSQWEGPGSADLNGDGLVDGADLGLLLAAWGNC